MTTMTLLGCEEPFWVKQKREAEIARLEAARQDAIRLKAHETWAAQEARRLLALCLDIAKFEKQWGNYAEWAFDRDTGRCTVSYKKPPAEKKTEKQCADLWLKGKDERTGDGPSVTAPNWKQQLYFDCTSELFSKTWSVARTK